MGSLAKLILIACIALMAAPIAMAEDVDWKLYGGATLSGPSFCFYDAHSVSRNSTGTIRVWTKCLAQKDLDSVLLDNRMVDSAANKILEGYVPPIVVFGKMDFDQVPSIVGYEEIANAGAIKPQAQIYDELNCLERMSRRLSTSMYVEGGADTKVSQANGNMCRLKVTRRGC